MSAPQTPRHPSLNLTDEQEANLRKLAAYLLTLPADYPDFEMGAYTADGSGSDWDPAHAPACGTAGCAAGHGPSAGIAALPGEMWGDYSYRAFTDDRRNGQWPWVFSAVWSLTDNTAHGAAARINWMLQHGVPEDAYEQRCGRAPLCYADPSK